MSDTLRVEKRNETGKLRMRRLRATGRIPAVLYGHGQESVNLIVDVAELGRVIAHGGHIVNLIGAVKESALLKAVQWDPLGTDILHLDLTRIDEKEAVEVVISLEFRGVAPGVSEGGVVRHAQHDIRIRCAANEVPDHLIVKLGDLHLNQAITAADIPLPPSGELLTDPHTIVAECKVPAAAAEEAGVEGATAPAEPELIGRKKEEAEEE